MIFVPEGCEGQSLGQEASEICWGSRFFAVNKYQTLLLSNISYVVLLKSGISGTCLQIYLIMIGRNENGSLARTESGSVAHKVLPMR